MINLPQVSCFNVHFWGAVHFLCACAGVKFTIFTLVHYLSSVWFALYCCCSGTLLVNKWRKPYTWKTYFVITPTNFWLHACYLGGAPIDSITHMIYARTVWVALSNFTVIAKILSGMLDKMSGRPSALCRTFWAAVRHFSQLMTGKYRWSFLFSLSQISCVLNSAGHFVRQGLSSLTDISRSLPDMSGIFRDHLFQCHRE